MKRVLFLKRSKSFSTNRLCLKLLLIISTITLLAGCSTVAGSAAHRHVAREKQQLTAHPAKPVPLPPWQLWAPGGSGNSNIAAGERELSEGRIEEAVENFRAAIESAPSSDVKEEAVLRAAGSLLRLGRSKEALDQVSRYVKSIGIKPEDADARLAFIVAFAYLHRKDPDQALAWLSLACKRAETEGAYGGKIFEQTRVVISSIPPASFDAVSQRWETDEILGQLFSGERLRRAQGGKPLPGVEAKWFNPQFYALGGVGPESGAADVVVQEEERPVPAAAGPLKIGVLLPMSGQFAQHAAQIRNGIDLAVEQYQQTRNKPVSLVYGDTKGHPETSGAEYKNLTQREYASVVLGPLLVRTTEEVAQEAKRTGVPFISFSKKEGLTQLGDEVWRLGATAADQVRTVLKFAIEDEGLSRFAVAYPGNAGGQEFADVFQNQAAALGAEITGSFSYTVGEEASAANAIRALQANPPQALFIADTLENALPLLQQINGMNLNVALLGPALWDDPVAIRGLGQLLENATYAAPFNGSSQRPEVTQFVSQYKAKYGRDPDLLAAQGFDAANFVLRAADTSPGDEKSLGARLAGVPPFEGVTGYLHPASSHEIERDLPILRINNGEAREILSTSTNPTTSSPLKR